MIVSELKRKLSLKCTVKADVSVSKRSRMRTVLSSKIHRATVTETNLNYEGSITIDKDLMEAANIIPYEQVHVLNLNNGERFVTYAVEGMVGEICLNGACARLGTKGDIVIILSYQIVEREEFLEPIVLNVDSENRSVCEGNYW